MLTENKFTKYLIYAFGEIVLVVIGILIALQVNNWNEQKQIQQSIKGHLVIFKYYNATQKLINHCLLPLKSIEIKP